MPLSRPESRKLLHLRDIKLRGYLRDDGLVDIEAQITDTKTYSHLSQDRGIIASGEPVHDMTVRVTVGQDTVIRAAEATMEATPYNICPGAAPNFGRLAGLSIGKGFIRAAVQRMSGVEGCTHLRELLQPIATVAFQTLISVRRHDKGVEEYMRPEPPSAPNALLNTCYGYDENRGAKNRP